MIIKRLKRKIPNPIKQSLKIHLYRIIPVRFHYSKVFWDTYEFLQKSEWWTIERLQEYQILQLEQLLCHAYKNIPYYNKIFKEAQLRPHDIQNLRDLRKLPYLTKDIFRFHSKEMIANNFNLDKLPQSHTSGTTGKPLQFYNGPVEHQKELSFVYHQWSRVGVKPGDPMIQLRGAIREDDRSTVYSSEFNALMFSPKVQDKSTIIYYLNNMKRFGAKFLHGYPGTIATFAVFIRRHGLRVPFKLKAILFASEKVYEWQRKIAEDVFRCRIYDFYGHSEHSVMAGECEYTNHYHFVPQYGITEIDPHTHEIIATGFLNYVNPFIRYRTTDIASIPIFSHCEYCNRNYNPVVERIEGRLEDFIITPEGIPISPAVITHPFKDFKTIKATQIVQESIDLINVNIVAWENAATENFEAEAGELHQGLSNLVGLDVKIDIHVVDDIPLLKSGKFKWIKSKVSGDSLLKGLK